MSKLNEHVEWLDKKVKGMAGAKEWIDRGYLIALEESLKHAQSLLAQEEAEKKEIDKIMVSYNEPPISNFSGGINDDKKPTANAYLVEELR